MKNRRPLGSILTPKLMKLVILVIWVAYIKSNAQILACINSYFEKYYSKLKSENKMKIDSVLMKKLNFLVFYQTIFLVKKNKNTTLVDFPYI